MPLTRRSLLLRGDDKRNLAVEVIVNSVILIYLEIQTIFQNKSRKVPGVMLTFTSDALKCKRKDQSLYMMARSFTSKYKFLEISRTIELLFFQN